MKILITALLNTTTSEIPLLLWKALRNLGCEVEMVSPNNDASLLYYGCLRSGNEYSYLALKEFSRCVLRKAEKFRPDAVLIYGSNYYVCPGLLRKLKQKLGCRIWLWEGNMQFWTWFMGGAVPYYDEVFLMDSYMVPVFRGPARKDHVYHLGSACDPEEHCILELNDTDRERFGADVSFIGSAFPERIRLFEQLTDLNLRLWGAGWDKSDKLRPFFSDEPVYGLKKTKIYNASKIVLSLQNPATQINGVSCRVFEPIACGSFVITEERKDLMKYFEVGKEIITYADEQDLMEKIRYYLAHEQERREMAARGRARILAEHTFEKRMRQLLDTVGTSV